ncbi:TPA: hypothetical protein ACX3KH_005733 [Raoultella ornithinolytica]
MTTDITELAQREKFEAWARSQKLSIAYGDCGYVYSSTEMAWRAVKALSAELVETLEKAQQRIAELESRTVKLPSLNPEMFNEDVMFGYRKAQKEAVDFCAAAGIKVEAE